jgi:hypothetical protein
MVNTDIRLSNTAMKDSGTCQYGKKIVNTDIRVSNTALKESKTSQYGQQSHYKNWKIF